MKRHTACAALNVAATLLVPGTALADEGIFGYTRGAETLPRGSWDLEQWFTSRDDKGVGTYHALDTKTEVDYGVTDRLQVSAALFGLGIRTEGVRIDAYIPKDEKYTFRPAGIEGALKYNYLSPAKDDVGLSQYVSLTYFNRDVHSGQAKDSYSFETMLIVQKYYREGEVIVAGNLGLEATSARRHPIGGLPPDFEWPTHPEMEIEVTAAAAISYRFAPNWFIGADVFYQTEHETEVGQERWSLQIGPTLHYGSQKWWASLTWMPQVRGGGTFYAGQTYGDLHLIEKTREEVRLKFGYNF
ncbi:MAG: hypothetical protein GC151_01870 [Betaproteobacteria bacterium]|nr:hypothetical protein [Betaproteobacteria bacterium]